ncbi:Ger(x)C family spore germination protein [Lysinibacillus sp. 54212]|uniref:Ger(x)C family spore germination protein n=1 Tax=Lysinibacillus sp. 54212 TaxID=3119829 RepID=UPI002FCBDA6D
MARFVLITIHLIALLFLTGCWDRIEIEQRAFAVGIAIDFNKNQDAPHNPIQITQQVIVPSVFNSAQDSGGDGQAFRNLTKSGETIFEANRNTTNLASRTISATHLEVVLFSEEVVKEPNLFANLMDVFLREMEMHRTINVAIVNGDAHELFNVEPEHEKLPAIYIHGLLENEESINVIKPITFGDIQENLLSKTSFIIPQISKFNSKSVEYEGIAVFHGTRNKVVATFHRGEEKGVIFMRGEVQSGSIVTNVEGNKIANEILDMKRDIALTNKDKNNLSFDVNLTVRSSIAEVLGVEHLLSEKNYAQIKKALEDEINKVSQNSINALQTEINADVLGLNQHLYKYHYQLWDSIKDNWEDGENYFSKSKINVNVNVIIDQSGNINKAQ